MRARLSFLSQWEMGNSLEFHIFPGVGTSLAEDVTPRVHRDDLQVVLLLSDLARRQFSELRGERDEAAIAFCIGEDARLEGLTGFFIDECSDLHPATCCELQQSSGRNNVTHTNF